MIKTILESMLAKGITRLWENRNHLWLYLRAIGPYRNTPIRFSISYLFRIRIPHTDNYLLVLNRRIANQLQPVGGVYKRYGDDKLFEKWEYQPDSQKNGLGTDEKSSRDLRFRVKGKDVIKVIKWFKEGREREVGAYREFAEELLETGILDQHVFQTIEYRHLKRVSKHLRFSKYHNCHEILIYDIMELLPNEEQKNSLLHLAADNPVDLDKGYAIVAHDDIGQLRYRESGEQLAKIGEHTTLIINQNF